MVVGAVAEKCFIFSLAAYCARRLMFHKGKAVNFPCRRHFSLVEIGNKRIIVKQAEQISAGLWAHTQ